MTISDIEVEAQQLLGIKRRVDSELSAARIEHRTHATRLRILEGVLELLELAGNAARSRVKDEVGGLMTAAMQDIFGADTDATVEFTEGARGYSARILTRGGGFRGDPTRTDGGSACRILEIALRAAFIKRLHGVPPLMCLDEPLAGVDDGHIHGAASWLLKSMGPALGLQILLVKHEHKAVFEPLVDRIIELDEDRRVTTEDRDDAEAA